MDRFSKKVLRSTDANVFKFIFTKTDAAVEAVLYRYGDFRKRTVICCSTQCGCPVGCKFCGTGRHFVRSLTAEEIVEQVHHVMETVDCPSAQIEKFQIMFMSMGEPFCNAEALYEAIGVLNEEYPNAALLVSTSAPSCIDEHYEAFIALSQKIDKVGIQFSVHESTDEARARLIPTPTCAIEHIAELGERWARATGRKPFYNYCVHPQNASDGDADRLVCAFNPRIWETTLSVICETDEKVNESIERQLNLINAFSGKLLQRGASVRVFNPAGQDDIGGGCGQLWFFQDWLRKHKERAEGGDAE